MLYLIAVVYLIDVIQGFTTMEEVEVLEWVFTYS